jgi:hypothetical protein
LPRLVPAMTPAGQTVGSWQHPREQFLTAVFFLDHNLRHP